MDTLFNQYNNINEEIISIQSKIVDTQKKITSINEDGVNLIPAKIKHLEEQLIKIDDYELKIKAFSKMAEDHINSKNLLTIEAPEGYRVNLSRLKKWLSMVDPSPTAKNDPYAQRVYLVAQCDLLFLSKKKKEFKERIDELKKNLEEGNSYELVLLENSIKQLNKELDDLIQRDDVIQFMNNVIANNENGSFNVSENEFTPLLVENPYFPIGMVSYPFEIHDTTLVKNRLNNFFDENNGKIFLPFDAIKSNQEFILTISCLPKRKRIEELDAGVRNLLMNITSGTSVGSRKIYVLDAERQNTNLLGPIRFMQDSYVMDQMPKTHERITASLEEIVSRFGDLDDELGEFDTVLDFNATNEKKIVRTVLVIMGWPNSKLWNEHDRELIQRILINHERYGISIIMANMNDYSKKEKTNYGLSIYEMENVINIEMYQNHSVLYFKEKEYDFKWYTLNNHLSDAFWDSFKSYKIEKEVLDNQYINFFDLKNGPEYRRNNKVISVPFGLNGKQELQYLSFENENFASFLMGASGSGKSTLLHTIITGILHKYHPDDVELWLADFKMSEFAQYMDPLPPHVKYILLDESPELVYDLIDKLTEKMQERQRYFMMHKNIKKVEDVPSDVYMPVIFVILDEFSIMSQAVAESENYKLLLQNLLAKGRALGIKFIFASQTFTKGISGLTSTAKEQIQTRIAMKNSYNEIQETLSVPASLKTEQVRNWMEALPPYYTVHKYREKENFKISKSKVLYFKGKGEEALVPQRTLIRTINDTYKAIDLKEYNPSNLNEYVYKNPIIVDGNTYKAFDDNKVKKELEKYRIKFADDIDADDILINLGAPRRMEESSVVTLSNESRENILMVARSTEQPCSIAMILTIAKSFVLQSGNVHVWAYSKNKLYKAYGDSHLVNYDVVEGLENICLAIREVKEKILNKEVGKDLYILLGMEQICSDFELIDFSSSSIATTINTEVFGTKEDRKAIAELQYDFELEYDLDALEDEWEEKGYSNAEIVKNKSDLFKKYLIEHGYNDDNEVEEDEIENNSIVETNANEENVDNEDVSDTKEESTAYNAMEDFIYIVKQGSRFGYHFMLCLTNFSDLRSTRLQNDLFRHKIVFEVSADDSYSLVSSKKATKLPRHVCLYTNTLDLYSLRPFIHEGITWDGWIVDSNGKAINSIGLFEE